MSQKQLLMRTFNKQLTEFIEDVCKVFPDNTELKSVISAMEVIRHSNPSLFVKQWYQQGYLPYREQIDAGDYDFFYNKSYNDDLANNSNAEKLLNIIEKIRGLAKDMSEENRQHTIKYLQVLSKISEAYAKTD